jgi:hypothetical protein
MAEWKAGGRQIDDTRQRQTVERCSARKEFMSSAEAAHQTEQRHEDSVADASHQSAFEGSK